MEATADRPPSSYIATVEVVLGAKGRPLPLAPLHSHLVSRILLAEHYPLYLSSNPSLEARGSASGTWPWKIVLGVREKGHVRVKTGYLVSLGVTLGKVPRSTIQQSKAWIIDKR